MIWDCACCGEDFPDTAGVLTEDDGWLCNDCNESRLSDMDERALQEDANHG